MMNLWKGYTVAFLNNFQAKATVLQMSPRQYDTGVISSFWLFRVGRKTLRGKQQPPQGSLLVPVHEGVMVALLP